MLHQDWNFWRFMCHWRQSSSENLAFFFKLLLLIFIYRDLYIVLSLQVQRHKEEIVSDRLSLRQFVQRRLLTQHVFWPVPFSLLWRVKLYSWICWVFCECDPSPGLTRLKQTAQRLCWERATAGPEPPVRASCEVPPSWTKSLSQEPKAQISSRFTRPAVRLLWRSGSENHIEEQWDIKGNLDTMVFTGVGTTPVLWSQNTLHPSPVTESSVIVVIKDSKCYGCKNYCFYLNHDGYWA